MGMHVNIVFFNRDHSDFLIFGPYKTMDEAQTAQAHLQETYPAAHAILESKLCAKPN